MKRMRELAEIGHDLGATHDPKEITGRIVGAGASARKGTRRGWGRP